MTVVTQSRPYAARLDIDYPDKLDRFTTFFRLLWVIPAAIVVSLLGGGLWFATMLLIVFRVKYPRWWFDFSRELARYGARVGAYFGLLTDDYPSTTDEQRVHIEIDYPDVENDLHRWLPLVKWLLALPHYFVLFFLFVGAIFVWVGAWFAILVTGNYPRGMFDYMVGVGRWSLRVEAYAYLMVTDEYPPFSLK
ncbi:MAG: DUF4389 domain-containing protein [bacterium]|nr:DUF4389 domain-containing protein [bacterium]MCP4965210.1 DUF4389 domain-containing protein [bacterium]